MSNFCSCHRRGDSLLCRPLSRYRKCSEGSCATSSVANSFCTTAWVHHVPALQSSSKRCTQAIDLFYSRNFSMKSNTHNIHFRFLIMPFSDWICLISFVASVKFSRSIFFFFVINLCSLFSFYYPKRILVATL